MQIVVIHRAVIGLREASWLDLMKVGYLILLASFLIGLAVPDEVRRTLVKPGGLVLVMLLIAAKDLVHAPEALARFRSARRQGLRAQVAACLPPGVCGWFRLERAMWHGCWAWACRRQDATERIAGTRLHFLQQGSYSAAVAIVLVAIVGELPLSHLAVSLMIDDPVLQRKLHFLLGFASIYSLVWLAGDRWHVGTGYHVLGEHELDLKVGARAAMRVPLGLVAGATRITESRAEWCRRNAVAMRDTVVLSPIDRPNLVLALCPGAQLPLTLFGLARRAPPYVFLYVDRPELLIAGIAPASH